MRDPEIILQEMELILKDLILTAEKLRHLSEQVVSEDEINSLQNKQNELMGKLQEADEEFKTSSKSKKFSYDKNVRKRITDTLEYFQKLNKSFIENLKKSSGVIEFEGKKRKKRAKR